MSSSMSSQVPTPVYPTTLPYLIAPLKPQWVVISPSWTPSTHTHTHVHVCTHAPFFAQSPCQTLALLFPKAKALPLSLAPPLLPLTVGILRLQDTIPPVTHLCREHSLTAGCIWGGQSKSLVLDSLTIQSPDRTQSRGENRKTRNAEPSVRPR